MGNTQYFNGVYSPSRIIEKGVDESGNPVLTTTILGREVRVRAFRDIPVLSFQDVAELLVNAEIQIKYANGEDVSGVNINHEIDKEYHNMRENFIKNSNIFRDGIEFFIIQPAHLKGAVYYPHPYTTYTNNDNFDLAVEMPNQIKPLQLQAPALYNDAYLKTTAIQPANRGTTYITESGFAMLMNLSRNPAAQLLMRDMIDGYFAAKNILDAMGIREQGYIETNSAMYGVQQIMNKAYGNLTDDIVNRIYTMIYNKVLYVNKTKIDLYLYEYGNDEKHFNHIMSAVIKTADFIYQEICKVYKITPDNLETIYKAIDQYPIPSTLLAVGVESEDKND